MLMSVFLSHVMVMLSVITLKALSYVPVMRDFLVMGFYVKVRFAQSFIHQHCLSSALMSQVYPQVCHFMALLEAVWQLWSFL